MRSACGFAQAHRLPPVERRSLTMRIQNQLAIQQLNSIQRAFNTKRSAAAPGGTRAIDQLVPQRELSKPLQLKPAEARRPVRINHDPVVVKPGSPRPADKPLNLPNKPLEKPSDSTIAASQTKSQDVASTLPVADDAASQSAQDPGELTLQGLQDAWGQRNSPYDINGDGTVNTADLLEFINSMPVSGQTIQNKPLVLGPVNELTTAPTSPQPDPTLSTAPPAAELTTAAPTDGADSAATPQLTLDGLMQAWGQADSSYDLNGDGTVNTGDLLQFLNNWSASKSANATSGNGAAGPENAVGKPGIGGVTKLADALIDRLMKAGFDDQPPTNIRDLVDTFNLPANHAEKLFDRLQQKYPNGLGVNVVA
jgi:hypothetical protein